MTPLCRNLLPGNLLRLCTPHRWSIGWAASIVVHATGAWIAWGAVVGSAPQPPKLLGQMLGEQIELQATWTVPRRPLPRPEPRPFEASIVVTPEMAQIGSRTYTLTDGAVSQPTPVETAAADRLLHGVPPTPTRRNPAEQAAGPTPPADSPTTTRPPRDADSHEPDVRVPPPSPQPSAAGDLTIPRRLDNRPPTYPTPAEMQRLEGTVLLRVHLSGEGDVERLEILTSSGHPILDAAAARAVRTWQYAPAIRDGRGVPFTFRQPVRFSLERP